MSSTIIFNAPVDSVKVELVTDKGYMGEFPIEYPINQVVGISNDDLATGEYDPVSGVEVKTTFKITPLNDSEIVSIDDNFTPHSWHDLTFSESGLFWVSNVFSKGALDQPQNIVVDINISGSGEPTPFKSPLSRVYVLNSSKLFEVSELDPDDPTNPDDPLKSSYVYNVIKIPFKIPVELIDSPEFISFGRVVTTISAETLVSDLISVDLGNIEVGNLEGNSLDYVQNYYKLFLPFIDLEIDLEPSLVVGKIINPVISIDAYTGSVDINVYNGGEIPIYSSKSSIGYEVPFRISTESIKLNNLGLGIDNDLLSAYIKRVRPELVNSTNSNLVSKTGTLLGVVGYVEVDYIDLDLDASFIEKNQIISILESGVVIK